MPEPVVYSAARLDEAAYLDEDKLKPLVDRLNPKKGSVLWNGTMSKEGSSVVAAFQTRYFVIDIDDQWRPTLMYVFLFNPPPPLLNTLAVADITRSFSKLPSQAAGRKNSAPSISALLPLCPPKPLDMPRMLDLGVLIALGLPRARPAVASTTSWYWNSVLIRIAMNFKRR